MTDQGATNSGTPVDLDTITDPYTSYTDRQGSLAEALAAFQADMPTVTKGQTAKVEKDGRLVYSYKYADLADVAQVAHPLLSQHGLSFTAQPRHIDGVGFVLVGVLMHTSGEREEGMLPIIGRDAQAIGSSLTYSRRYLLGCMTGIVTDDDDDGTRAANARTERPASELHPQSSTPPREQIMGKLDESCAVLGKSRAEVTKKWRQNHGELDVRALDDPARVPDAMLFEFVAALQPYVEVARTNTERFAEAQREHADPFDTPTACGETHEQVTNTETGESVRQTCQLPAGHAIDHVFA